MGDCCCQTVGVRVQLSYGLWNKTGPQFGFHASVPLRGGEAGCYWGGGGLIVQLAFFLQRWTQRSRRSALVRFWEAAAPGGDAAGRGGGSDWCLCGASFSLEILLSLWRKRSRCCDDAGAMCHPIDGGVSSTLLLPVTHYHLHRFAGVDLVAGDSMRSLRDASVPTVPEFQRELAGMELIPVCAVFNTNTDSFRRVIRPQQQTRRDVPDLLSTQLYKVF